MEVKEPCHGQGFGWARFRNQSNGYTLIELLITLAVLSVLALNVFPNISSLVAKERTIVLTNKLARTLAYARSEAIIKQVTILTCQSDNGTQCQRSENWHNGWIMFADKNSNKLRDPDEHLLQVSQASTNGSQATFRGGAGIRHYVKYKPDGQAFPNGSFLICNPDMGTGSALIITHSGRVRLSKVQTNGSTITCH